jgi:hypothetical protein
MPDGWDGSRGAASTNMSDRAAARQSDVLFYIIAIALGALAGLAHIGIGDPLITALVVLASTMFLGFMRPEQPWRWTLAVGIMVPLIMIGAHLAGRYANFTRAGIYGSVLLILPGFAGAYGGFFGRKFMTEVFFADQQKK